ncbi:MAG TPA: hypothetical protein VLG47_08200 [Candidatus Saccharimonadales bacterium]|nr:hypothetical protein [Candidatus Saccharimonadales bacterium]
MITVQECTRGVEEAFMMPDDVAWRLSRYQLPPYGEPISACYPARHAGAAAVARELIYGAEMHEEADMSLEVAPVCATRVERAGDDYVVTVLRGVALWRIDVPIPTD